MNPDLGAKLKNKLRYALRGCLDVVAPRRCVACGRRLSCTEEHLCAVCLKHAPVTGFQFNPYENRMAKDFWGLVKSMEKAAAWFYYEPGSEFSNIIKELKYRHQPTLGLYIGEMMAYKMKESGFFDDIDCMVPVPITQKRKRQRGYNQAECIANGIRNVLQIPVVSCAVERVEFTGSQTRLRRLDRMNNVERAFRGKNLAVFSHSHVLLVDDVTTTGATLTAVANVLQQVADIRISVLTAGYTR
ncbi:MAG: ComF family protein [Prevotella sp.]